MSPFSSTQVILIALSMLILQTVLTDIATVRGDPDTTVTDIQCSKEKWGPNDPYGTIVVRMLYDMAALVPSNPYYEDYVDYSSGDTNAYGFSKCSLSLSPDDCATCLVVTRGYLLDGCPFSRYASVELMDCRMKYDDYPFNG